MNILIIGEFSGFAYNLKKGFEVLGHYVIVVQNGDGFKNIPTSGDDIFYNYKYLRLGGKSIPQSALLFNWLVTKRIGNAVEKKNIHFDLIVIICDKFVAKSWRSAGFPYRLLKKYKQEGSKIILTSCGGDAAYIKYVRDFPYYKIAFPNGIKMPSRFAIYKLRKIIEITSCIVPTAYDYDYTIRKFISEESLLPPKIQYIQLPINKEEASSTKNDKTVIFHGINRPIRKGTPYIKEALIKIKEKYADSVDIIIEGGLPFIKYCELLNKADIIIDQTNSFGTGVNGEIGLMKGKVVLGGNSSEERELRGYDSPIINIESDSNMIFSVLESLILNRIKMEEIKKKSREYALTYLRADIIANQYIASVL